MANMNTRTVLITQGAIIAAAYILLTLPLAQVTFGPLQFRLAEALTVLPLLTPAAIPGLFLGCLLSNAFNPAALGPIDIVFGSLATLVAAWLTWRFGRRFFKPGQERISWKTLMALLPPVIINGLVVGFYLPFILPEMEPDPMVVASTILTVALSEAVVVFLVGVPLLIGLDKSGIFSPRGNQ